MAAAKLPQATPDGERDSPPFATTEDQRASIRNVFEAEFGVAHVQLIKVETAVLYKALCTRRHADTDDQDDGSLHSEVLKNSTDLLQRFHRCAPLYLKKDPGHRPRNNNFFAKEVFCRTFCHDIEGFDNRDNPRAWIDVFHFLGAMKKIWDLSLLGGRKVSGQAKVAAMLYAHGGITPKATTWTRKGALLWALMGRASEAIDRHGSTRFETWCVEATVRIGTWRKKLEDDKDSLFRLPVEDDWGNHPDEVLPERNNDAMKLFREMETKLRAFYMKCNEQMPEQRTAFPTIAKKLPTRADTPENIGQDDGPHDQRDQDDIPQGDSTSEEEEMTPKMAFPRVTRRGLVTQKAARQMNVGERPMLQNGTSQEIISKRSNPQPTASQMKAHQQNGYSHRPHPHALPSRKIITQDPRRSIAPSDPGFAELERAKAHITNVVRANGRQPDWDPKLPRMVISANFHRN
ncbi:hypothetical protein diail_8457 [Diaporthe ilicicola]|nr:hypothetical protein diail_8457 [Diaporthe ilicicola]